MTSDPIAAWQDAFKSRERATAEAERLVGIVIDAAKKLENHGWRGVEITNVGGGDLPPAGTPTIAAADWPTADQLADALSAWRASRVALRKAYSAVPHVNRGVLKLPPD